MDEAFGRGDVRGPLPDIQPRLPGLCLSTSFHKFGNVFIERSAKS